MRVGVIRHLRTHQAVEAGSLAGPWMAWGEGILRHGAAAEMVDAVRCGPSAEGGWRKVGGL